MSCFKNILVGINLSHCAGLRPTLSPPSPARCFNAPSGWRRELRANSRSSQP